MKTAIETFDDLLSRWTTLELSAALGVPYVTARKMRERKSVAVPHWAALLAAAAERGIFLSYDDLVAMRSASAPAKDRAA
jgi:hypothetical protein